MAPIPPALRALAGDAARGIGRGPGDAEPFARILVDNWFDSPGSVANCKPEELAALGIPLRFAQQLVTLASGGGPQVVGRGGGGGGGDGGRRSAPASSSLPLAHRPPAQRQEAYRQEEHRPEARGRERESNNEVRRLRVRDMDPAFRARGGIIGTRGRNLMHIQDETHVKVDCRGDGQREPLELLFREAPSNSAMERAMKMGKSLLATVYDDYAQWQKEHHGGGGAVGRGAERPADAPTRGRPSSRVDEAEFRQSVEVAECDPGFAIRGRLLGSKGKNLRDIEARTGAAVQLRGESGEAMRFEIGASSEDQLLEAQDLVEALLSKSYTDYDEWLASGGGEAREAEEPKGRGRQGTKRKASEKPGGGEFNDVLELQRCDPGFTIRGKLLGARGSRIRRIEEDTGAAVSLTEGEDGEPTHVEISATSPEVLDAAMRAGEELIQAVYDEYASWLAMGGGSAGGGGKGKSRGAGSAGKGGGESPMALRKVLKLKECDPAFDLRNKVKGTKCVNLHHIHDETGAQVWVVGERGEPIRLEVAANDQGVLDRGLAMAKELIKSVFKDYDAWLRQRGGPPASKRMRPSAAPAA